MPDYTILLIDYDPRSIERTTGLLVGAGYSVEVAKNGIEGLAAFKRLSPGLVLVEAMLPKKHGFEVCQELKATPHGKTSPVLIVTAVYKGRKYRHQAMHHYGANGYIEKPITDEGLEAAVRSALGMQDDPAGVAIGSPLADEAAGRDVEPPAAAERVIARPDPPPARAQVRAEITDPTELEILERLDFLIPGDSSAGDPR